MAKALVAAPSSLTDKPGVLSGAENRRLRARSNTEDLHLRPELRYRVDWPVCRSTIYVLAKAPRTYWKLVTGFYG